MCVYMCVYERERDCALVSSVRVLVCVRRCARECVCERDCVCGCKRSRSSRNRTPCALESAFAGLHASAPGAGLMTGELQRVPGNGGAAVSVPSPPSCRKSVPAVLLHPPSAFTLALPAQTPRPPQTPERALGTQSGDCNPVKPQKPFLFNLGPRFKFGRVSEFYPGPSSSRLCNPAW